MLHRTFDRLLQTLLIFGVVLLLGSRIVGVYHHDQSLVQQVSFKVVNVGRTYDPTPSNPSLRYSLILRGLGTNTTSILSNVTFNLSVDGLSVGRVNFERIHILPFYTQLSVGAYKPELGVRFTTYDMGTILALAGRPSGELAGHCL